MRVEDMPAGLDMDALIAQEVMNWEYDAWADGWKTLEGILDLEDWQPSTDIAAAWQVVEKFGYFALDRNTDQGGVWFCEIGHHVLSYPGIADTAPLAICRAALPACGVTEVPDILEKNREILHGDGSGEI